MGLYHVGDRVVVRSDLTADKRYYMADSTRSDICVSEMIKLAGETVTISEVLWHGKYIISESKWVWTDGMFAGLEESVCKLPSVDDLL